MSFLPHSVRLPRLYIALGDPIEPLTDSPSSAEEGIAVSNKENQQIYAFSAT